MKGIIFNLLEDVVVDAYGERSWDEALDRAGLDGVYTSLGNYDDAQIIELFSVIAAQTSVSVDDVHRWFGQRALPKMARRGGCSVNWKSVSLVKNPASWRPGMSSSRGLEPVQITAFLNSRTAVCSPLSTSIVVSLVKRAAPR